MEYSTSDPSSRQSYEASSRPTEPAESPINVGRTERELSVVAGGVLALLALRRPLSLRGLALGGLGAAMIQRGVTGHCPVYTAMGIHTSESSDSPSAAPHDYSTHAIHIEESVTIMKPPAELYAFWRNLENLPKFMEHIQEIKPLYEKRSHWTTRGPMRFNVEWDAEIINDEADSLIAWRSVGASEVDSTGSVRFQPIADGQGTQVRVTMDYIPPAGVVGHYVAKFLGEDPAAQCRNDLRKLKQLLEAGEIATNNDGHPRGTA
jgi:uncharacterized membrane protein